MQERRNDRTGYGRIIPVFVAFGMLVLAALACDPQGLPQAPQAPEPPEVAEVQSDAQVRRYGSTVWTGVSDPLLRLDDDEWRGLPAGGLVTTDERGEGWVQILDCMVIYVFQRSRLIKSGCSRDAAASGNVLCSIEGTSVYNNACAGEVRIETPSADILLTGTWLSVTYLPGEQLTLVMVFEGEVQARPVRNIAARTLAEAGFVSEGHFWFTTPGVQADPVAGLDAREPHPFHQLPPLLEELDLGGWWERLEERAGEDNVPFPEFESPEPEATPTWTPTFTPTPTITPTPTPSITPTPTPTEPAEPNLGVSSLRSVGRVTRDEDGRLVVPIEVVVSNWGGSPAGIFKVAVEYSDGQRAFLAPFTVRGQESIWYPFTQEPLAPSGMVTFTGSVSFSAELEGERISLWALADSCAGEEFTPDYCRVEESDETDNTSNPISVVLEPQSTTPGFVLPTRALVPIPGRLLLPSTPTPTPFVVE